jgi:hypothetical protein
MAEDPLADLRRIVVDDRLLRDRLLSAPDRQAFIVGGSRSRRSVGSTSRPIR